MTSLPPSQLLNTFRIALILRLTAVGVALLSAKSLVDNYMVHRWWMTILTTVLLMVLLLPLPQRPVGHFRLKVALVFAIVAPQLDLLQSLWTDMEPLISLPIFINRLNWTVEQLNDVHALGVMFTMVPVVLASWQYGRRGMWGSLFLAGILYVFVPFIMPANAFTWRLYIVRGFVLLGVTLILAFTTYILATAEKRERHALAEANKKLAEQNATIEQLAISQERNRLARELHDTLAHALSGTAVQLQAVGTLLKIDPEAAGEELKTAQAQIKAGLQESRRAITALRASPLEELGLITALQQRATELGERAGIHITTHFDALPKLPPPTEQAIYRITDEALLNAEKHAQATEIILSLKENADLLTLTIQDNGIGFSSQREQPNGHFGLIGMQERAELVGGVLTINSMVNAGTIVQLKIEGEG